METPEYHEQSVTDIALAGAGHGHYNALGFAENDIPISQILDQSVDHLRARATLSSEDSEAAIIYVTAYRAAFLTELLITLNVRLQMAAVPATLSVPTSWVNA